MPLERIKRKFAIMNIAKHVIDKCGGAPTVAAWLGLGESTVYKWPYPKHRGGAGGLVPSRYQQDLIYRARENGVDLTPGDFFEVESAE